MIFLIAFVIVAGIAYRDAQDVATRATLLSLCKALESIDATQYTAELNVPKVLDDEEYRQVMHDLSSASIDTRPGRRTDDGYLTDRWGSRFEISITLSANEAPEFRAWSRGGDRVSATQDDILLP
jgi:hypothetical protein